MMRSKNPMLTSAGICINRKKLAGKSILIYLYPRTFINFCFSANRSICWENLKKDCCITLYQLPLWLVMCYRSSLTQILRGNDDLGDESLSSGSWGMSLWRLTLLFMTILVFGT
jgi:hypothetical protein